MIKNKVTYLYNLKSSNDLNDYDAKIQSFINELCEEGHLFISVNTVSFGIGTDSGKNLRTMITYQENITRKTIVEKINNG